MLKVMLLLKRKPGMSLEEFIERYELAHAPLVNKNGSRSVHYERHYLHPRGKFIWDLESDETVEPEYDVITEVWYEDLDAFNAQMDDVRGHPERLATIIADEEEMFDRDKSRVTFVESYSSKRADG
jgi:hypothetical protein